MKALLLALLLLAPAAEGARVIDIQLHDNPLHVAPERLQVAVGEEVTFRITNGGATTHDLAICPPAHGGGHAHSECGEPLAFTPLLQPGQVANLTLAFPSAGTYEYHCRIPGHGDAGMHGSLQVGAEAQSTPMPALALVLLALLVAARRRP